MSTALVTGGGSGIGRALCLASAARGLHLVVTDVDGEAAERVAEEVRAAGGRATAVRLDVRDADAVAAAVAEADAAGDLDLLVASAGIAVAGSAEELTPAHWDAVLAVNLHGVVNAVTAAYARMCPRGRGRILTVASMAGLVPAPGLVAYAATKHAVVGLSLSLRAEARTHGVGVTTLCPAFVDTPLLDSANPGLPQTAASRDGRATALRSQRRLLDPAAVADAALRGLDRDRAVVVLPATARLAWWAARLSPALAVRAAARVATARGPAPDTTAAVR